VVGYRFLEPASMIPLDTLGRFTTPDGKELVLYRRDGIYHIRVDGLELMSNRAHGSEDALAELACGPLRGRRRSEDGLRVLVGGLGMGYTLRAALEVLPKDAVVDVVEVFAAVVEWNRGLLAPLARRPLQDRRVRVIVADLGMHLAAAEPLYDVFLLDVDNGPEAFTLSSNAGLYSPAGLATIRRRLKPAGTLAVWSSAPSPRFEKQLRRAGFTVRTETVAARHEKRGPRHTIFVARPQGGAQAR